jgi:hypothetical protein
MTSLLPDRDLLAAALTVGEEQLLLNVRRAEIAGEVASREEMFRAAGHNRAAHLLAEVWQVTIGEAQRFVDVGLATRGRVAIDGSPLPAPFEAVAAALPTIGIDKAAVIVREVGRAQCSFEAKQLGESELVAHSAGFTVADFGILARQVRDRLDQDGARPRDEIHRGQRALRIMQRANGMTRLEWDMPPETAGLVRAGIDAIVSAQLRQARDEKLEDERTFEQRRSDAATDIFHHVASCAHTGGEVPAYTMVVRMTLDALLTGSGFAEIDGVAETISATTARHLAAEAEFIPHVLDGQALPLDYGRPRRLFSRGQRLALIARDGGCAFAGCSSPPAYGEAHHLEWWSHGGPTNLSNGVMLCAFHHHRIHNDGWEIEVRGDVPYVIPPPWVDPARVPRRGGRVRLDRAA